MAISCLQCSAEHLHEAHENETYNAILVDFNSVTLQSDCDCYGDKSDYQYYLYFMVARAAAVKFKGLLQTV